MAKVKRHKPRNPVATMPIMRKGGVHEKSGSSKRQQSKRQLRKLLDNVKAGSSGLNFVWRLEKGVLFAQIYNLLSLQKHPLGLL